MKILKFYLDPESCKPCKQLGEWLATVTLKHEVVPVHVRESMELVDKYGVDVAPTVVLLDDAGELVKLVATFARAKEFLQTLVVK